MKRSNWLWLVPAVVVSACSPTIISGDDGGDADVASNSRDVAANDVAQSDVLRSDAATDAAPPPLDSSSNPDASTLDAEADSSVAPDSAVDDSSSVSDAASDVSSTEDAAADSGADASGMDSSSEDASSEDAAADSTAEDASADASAEAGADASADAGAGVGFTVARVAGGASCDSPAGWTNSGLSGDDATFDAPRALPFSLGYYGDAVTHWSASTNGFAELWRSDSEIPSDSFGNELLPTAEVNGAIVAPFWDDLDVVSGSSVQSATIGAAPSRRFVVEWSNISTVDNDETLRFQVKFFETTNVIEFHYCSLTTAGSATRHLGDEATVGLQNLSQTLTTNVSHNLANALETGLLLRFTPR